MDIFDFIIILIKMAMLLAPILSIVPFIVLLERKMAGWVQLRPGPNRVGPWGLLQGIVDGVKVFLKEDVEPRLADKPMFYLAPILAMAPTLICLSVIPFGPVIKIPETIPYISKFIGGREIALSITDIPVGLIFVFAVSALGVYGIVLAGWSSNSKYSMLGGIRSAAQVVSYDIGLILSVVGIVIFSGSLNLREIAMSQSGGIQHWFIWKQPLGFVIFIIGIFAETNRLPFDLPEGESEITGGYHTEYSSMKFAMFFLGEYVAMITMSALGATLFLGGWLPPVEIGILNFWWGGIISGMIWFTLKVGAFILFFIFIRWTFPRFRFDQLLSIGWKFMIFLGLINVFLTALLYILNAHTIFYLISGVLIILIADLLHGRNRRKELEGYMKLPNI